MTGKYRIDYEQSIEIIEEQLRHEPKMDWNEGDPRPPWKPDRDKRYRQKMTDWVNWHLDHAPTPDFTPSTPDEAKRQWESLKNDGPEIAAAERGDIEPLRKKLPTSPSIFILPSGGAASVSPACLGTKAIREVCGDRGEGDRCALAEVLWEEEGATVEPSAAEIAAGRWHVEVADVASWVTTYAKI